MTNDPTLTPAPEAGAAPEGLNPPADQDTGLETPAGDGYLQALRMLRGSLPHARGLDYKAFRAGLRPAYGQVWRDLAPAHLGIAATLVGLAWSQPLLPAPWGQAALVPVGALVLGALINYVVLFLHEAAHHGLHPDRALNDRLAYALIGILLGADVTAYRASHFEHHRRLGEPGDTEHSYFDAPSWGLVFGTLSGARSLRMALGRRYMLGSPAGAGAGSLPTPRRAPLPLLGGLAFHAALLGGLLLAGRWVPALAWVVAMGSVFPLLGALRQILEHRAEAASAAVDYARIPHGATSRLFGDGLFARFFGGAGFNRHLLHHFEPAVSYTRLGELEAFLRETPLAGYLESRTTTYARTLRTLLGRP